MATACTAVVQLIVKVHVCRSILEESDLSIGSFQNNDGYSSCSMVVRKFPSIYKKNRIVASCWRDNIDHYASPCPRTKPVFR